MKLKFVFAFLLLSLSYSIMATTTLDTGPESSFDPLHLVSLLTPLIVWGAVELSKKILIISPIWILALLVPLLSGISTYLLSLIVSDLNFILTFVLGFVATFIDQFKKQLQTNPLPT